MARSVRATICIDVNSEDLSTQVKAWFAEWRDTLTHVSQDQGCGCCVRIWDVEGPGEAIEQIPDQASAGSKWAGYDANEHAAAADAPRARLRGRFVKLSHGVTIP